MAGSDIEVELAQFLARFQHDPLGFVRAAFPWGEPGTALADIDGPRTWQADQLDRIGKRLRAGADPAAEIREVIQESIASGHGIGKSAEVSWLTLWGLSTFEDSRVVVTANTGTQLATKTWPELKKWHRLAINGHWFEYTATSLHSVDPNHEKTWRADALPWSKENSEAFAGLHNQGKRVLLIFDEASAIADEIWSVAEGALTDADTELLWCVFGNPTRNTGRFRETFGRQAHRWSHTAIDSRTVEGTNKPQMAKWVEDYGEDSDFVRVRVRGVFPRAGSMQFIGSDLVDAATKAPAACHLHEPVVMGVDVARYGDDESCIRVRRGRDARTIPPIYLRGVDTMALVGRIVAECERLEKMAFHVDMVFIDETGVGAGVVDRATQLLGARRVIGVNNGAKADSPAVGVEAVANKGAECWAKMREALRTGLAIEDDPDLRQQLEGREYGYDAHNRIVLERKDDMKRRGLSSPDRADVLALTYAYPVAPLDQQRMRPGKAKSDYNPYEER